MIHRYGIDSYEPLLGVQTVRFLTEEEAVSEAKKLCAEQNIVVYAYKIIAQYRNETVLDELE